MRVLVACEFSGIVRDAFRERGHSALSVDLLPSERPGLHIQGDVLDVLRARAGEFDLMIAHPPCTYLANSGVRWLYGGKGTERDPERWEKMREAAGFFALLLSANVPRIAVENPIMHSHGRETIEGLVERYQLDYGIDFERQTIQPWQFGHGETKATQLWLRNLPPLTPTDVVEGREARVHRMAPSANRWAERSRTFTGIAAAMAEQWGSLEVNRG
jgi:hypothetical protein